MIRRVIAGTPAYDQGLNAGDQIVALNNMRVTQDFFNTRLAEMKPGDTINLTIFRFDDLRNFQIKLGGRINAPYTIVPVAQPNEQQSRLYQDWMSAPRAGQQ